MMEAYTSQFIATLLLSFRIAPTFAFAPPFTLVRTPASVRVLLALSLSFWIILANPSQANEGFTTGAALIPAFLSELLLGILMSGTLQLAFAAMLMAGRAIDIQVGFGLAQIADPTLRTHMPLVGTLFSYAAGAVFFATSGPTDLLAIWSRSVEIAPVGAFAGIKTLAPLLTYISGVFVLAMGLAGPVLLVLFLIDITIAFLSRTLPQMNVLVLGFQVKSLALLVTLPFVFSFSGALFLRLVRAAIDAIPRLI